MTSVAAAPTDVRHLVVVGASTAGVKAVEAARRAGYDGRITLIGDEAPYDRPPLSKSLLSVDGSTEPTPLASSPLAAELVQDRAVGLDVDARCVFLEQGELSYDALVIATGSRARTLGTDLAGVHTLRSLGDARGIRRALDARTSVAVIGGGFIGAEVASAARARGLETTVVEAAPALLTRALGPHLGVPFARLHEAHGTRVRCASGVRELRGDHTVTELALSDGSVLAAGLVVVGIGSSPCTEWIGDALDVEDGVLCDATLRTSDPAVWAAGDVARVVTANGGSHRLEHWTAASEQGARAALNALRPDAAESYASVPYYWSDWYGHRIQGVGRATEAEPIVVHGSYDDVAEGRPMVALMSDGDRLAGVVTLDAPRHVMKYRHLLAGDADLSEALNLAERLGSRSAPPRAG